MAFNKFKPLTKKEFIQDRIAMSFGSICNLYSGTQDPPTSKEVYEEAMEITEKEWELGQRFDSFPELEEKLEKHFEEEQHEKKIGRYSASEIWALLNNRIPPTDYLKPRVFNEESKKKMYWGVIIHEGIQKLFGFEEKKYEIEVDTDIKIVCKIDLEIGNKIWEFKTRENIDDFDEIPSWYNLQCQCYLKAKGLKEMKIVLIGWGFTRKIFDVKYDERIWDYISKGIKKYHLEVLKIK